jgi:hypothetical protein
MGLDIVIYRQPGREILEINERLHKEIFNEFNDLAYLNKISDYYKTDITFNANEIEKFINDLDIVKNNLSEKFAPDLEQLITKLKDSRIIKIHIAGD